MVIRGTVALIISTNQATWLRSRKILVLEKLGGWEYNTRGDVYDAAEIFLQHVSNMETLILILLGCIFIGLPLAWGIILDKRSVKEDSFEQSAPEASEAKILEQMCQPCGNRVMLRRILQSAEHLTGAESAILTKKLWYGRDAFPVSETVSSKEIERWLNHPSLKNRPMSESFLVNMASATAIDTKTMKRILRKAYGEYYDTGYRSAKYEVMHKRPSPMRVSPPWAREG